MQFDRNNHPCRGERGFTVAEMVSSIFIIGSFMLTIVAVLTPLLRASGGSQAKLDTVQAAAQGFYQIQRDLRDSTINGVFVCDNSANPTCLKPASIAALAMNAAGTTSSQVLAMPTGASNGSGTVQVNSVGNPAWQGVVIYRITNNGLERAFGAASTSMSNPPTLAQIADAAGRAVQNANAGTSTFLAQNINSLSTAMSTTTVSLQMVATSQENSSSNSTSYHSDTIPRNPK